MLCKIEQEKVSIQFFKYLKRNEFSILNHLQWGDNAQPEGLIKFA